MALRALSLEELRQITGTDQLVICRAGGLYYEGTIVTRGVSSEGPVSFSFSGHGVQRPTDSVTVYDMQAGEFYSSEEDPAVSAVQLALIPLDYQPLIPQT